MIGITQIKNRVVKFQEDLPEPAVYLYGTPVYRIKVRIGGKAQILELYNRKVIRQLQNVGNLSGREAMIQLPEQESAEWSARMV